MSELEKLFKFGAESVEHLFKVQGYLVPMWVGISDKGAHVPIIVPDLDDKDAVAEKIKEFLKKEKIQRYVCMMEAWIYEGKEMPPEVKEGKSIEHNPDRREVIHILAEDRDGNTMSGQYYILRPEHGKPKLSPLKVHEKASRTEGRFARMFN